MQELIERFRERLSSNAYVNEAAISHGIVTPMLNALGWDSADPAQLVPEYSIPQHGRVDFALLGLAGRPVVFIEVKGLGLAMNGDRQLFEYAFHHGVPLCVLTDGREWSFYVPSGQGSYDDRRVYRLQLDDRDDAECQRVLQRYLDRERVRSGVAFEDAQRDHRDAVGQREAVTALPRAWEELVRGSEELLLDLLADKAEALCGFKPSSREVSAFVHGLRPEGAMSPAKHRNVTLPSPGAPTREEMRDNGAEACEDQDIVLTVFGEKRTAATGGQAMVEILGLLARRDPTRLPALADAVRGRSRNMIARSVAEINPDRPDLARAVEFAPGWLVGLNLSNQDKMAIVRAACTVFGASIPGDVTVQMPNAV